MEIQDFAEEYEKKTDEELLRLALTSEQVTPDANVALNDELRRRRINTVDKLRAFNGEEDERRKEVEKNPGTLFFFYHLGIGRKRFGKADYTYNPRNRHGAIQNNDICRIVLAPAHSNGHLPCRQEAWNSLRRNYDSGKTASCMGASIAGLGGNVRDSFSRNLDRQAITASAVSPIRKLITRA